MGKRRQPIAELLGRPLRACWSGAAVLAFSFDDPRGKDEALGPTFIDS
jgi:hypothetical protein